MSDFTTDEMMTVAAARALSNDDVCFVGIGAPSAACNLARLTHAPDITLIYESGTIGTAPDVLPLSIGDGELCDTATTTVPVPEMFRYWLQGGRITIGFLGAAQLDKFGNIKGPNLLITDMAIWRPDPETKEFTVVSLHPGATREAMAETVGWDIRYADNVEETPAPTAEELEVLRALHARTQAAHAGK